MNPGFCKLWGTGNSVRLEDFALPGKEFILEFGMQPNSQAGSRRRASEKAVPEARLRVENG